MHIDSSATSFVEKTDAAFDFGRNDSIYAACSVGVLEYVKGLGCCRDFLYLEEYRNKLQRKEYCGII